MIIKNENKAKQKQKNSSSELERYAVFRTELEEPSLNRYTSFFD